MTGSRTLVVVVLRGMDWESSPVAQSLALAGAPLAVCVFSNGNSKLPPVEGLIEFSREDETNPGVGPRYLQAARLADERGDSYLLLLDQDFQAELGWWNCYEVAVAVHPYAACWAPRLYHNKIRLSPFSVKNGYPRRSQPLSEGLLEARTHVALNSGLLIRTESVLMASHELTQAPLDFSDYALFHRLGRAGASLAGVPLDLNHDSSTHAKTTPEARLERFAWFCSGGRAYCKLDPLHAWSLWRWTLGRALKLALIHRNRQFLSTWKRHFVDAKPPLGST